MSEPLLEPAVLVSENCPECRGTGKRLVSDAYDPGQGEPCGLCEGAGRLVSEVPFSVAYRGMADAAARATAPPPSMLRDQG